ncbi:MAG: hypothetical protein HY903_00010 [Deltaproteobacteria bacterium]|nr:hypothetical protein [Deltaproteobacteria bacterium]
MDAKAAFKALSERARERWLGFRARSVYFQLKILVLALYGVAVAATILWAPEASHAKNQIGARILVLEGDVVVGRYFIIQNESRRHWQNVTFELDDGYTVTRDLVAAGDKETLYVKDFHKKVVRTRRGRTITKTVAAPVDLNVTRLKVSCSEGEAVEPVSAAAAPETAALP